jgi:hypothetical protein
MKRTRRRLDRRINTSKGAASMETAATNATHHSHVFATS